VITALDGVSLDIGDGELWRWWAGRAAARRPCSTCSGCCCAPTAGKLIIDGTDTKHFSATGTLRTCAAIRSASSPGVQPAALTERARERVLPLR